MPDTAAPTFRTVSYTQMKDGTAEDYRLVTEQAKPYRAAGADRIIAFMETMRGSNRGNQVDQYDHCLQTATRALRDGADEETVVAALIHDIGDHLAYDNHSEFAAVLLRPYVGPETYWMVAHHGIFQGYYYFHHLGRDRDEREKYRGHPAFEKTVEFCEKWDQAAFDPNYDTMPFSEFEPALRRVFARTPWRFA